jgi:uncharacterized damage-inducible protein DinB
MREVERIAGQLRCALEGEAWHGPAVLELLDGVDAGAAAARPLPGAHSIWEIVLHLAAWHDAVRRRVGGEVVQLDGAEDWPPASGAGEAAWAAACDALSASYRRLYETILTLQDSELERRTPGKDYALYFMLHGVVQHDLYHAGQIALLKKAIVL